MAAVMLVLLFTALPFLSLAQDPIVSAKYDEFVQLSPPPLLYELYWTVTGSTVRFAVRVQTEGWVGFGISQLGLMPDSDVVMGFVNDATGVVEFTVSARTGSACQKRVATVYSYIIYYKSFLLVLYFFITAFAR